jgi:hypothetical protein
MPERLFVFVQVELPFRLALTDGRYLVRGRAGGDAEHVLVVRTIGRAPRAASRGPLRRLRSRGSRARVGRSVAAQPAPLTASNTRATVIDAVSLSAERQAQAWLDAIAPEEEIRKAFAVLNGALLAQRIAAADPAVNSISPGQALAIRVGWGRGEQVADGRWSHARELQLADSAPRRRVEALRPQERFAALLGARSEALVCEELALRARHDLELGRVRHAALELDRAYAAALSELPPTLVRQIDELRELRGGVADAAAAALDPAREHDAQEGLSEEVVSRALLRLEAALRARAAAS